MRVLVTGANGFIGWHTRLRLAALSDHEVLAVDRTNWASLGDLAARADAVIHLAGVNRAATAAHVEEGNLELARSLAGAIGPRQLRLVYANSIQDGNSSPYGQGKAGAREILRQASSDSGGSMVDVRLPNVFGEHGLPNYNSFVATFVDSVIRGVQPRVSDGHVGLVHAQGAAALLLDALDTEAERVDSPAEEHEIAGVWALLQEFAAHYLPRGDIPDLSSPFRVDLFNTFRAALFPSAYPIVLVPHSDTRGSFVETVRSHGGEGQTSMSTTVPGVTRGEHFHLTKIERFVVLRGQATIRLRRMFTNEVVQFHVEGERPVAVDMPTGWAHDITNVGSHTLLTQFWSNEIFRPEAPDTFPERVVPTGSES